MPSVQPSPETPAPIPVSAEDFFRRRRRIVLAWTGAVILAGLLGFWAYRRSVDPLNAQQALDEGRRLVKANRYTEAILSLDHALALKRDLPEAYRLLGEAHFGLGHLDSAIQAFSDAIRLRPGDADPYVERAQAKLAQQDYAGVVEDCSAALARNSNLALAYNLKGAAVRQSGKPRESLEDFSQAIALAPDEANYFQRAATYQALGEHKLAIADLDQVIALKPDGPQAYYARSLSRQATGDVAGADQDRRHAFLLEGR